MAGTMHMIDFSYVRSYTEYLFYKDKYWDFRCGLLNLKTIFCNFVRYHVFVFFNISLTL